MERKGAEEKVASCVTGGPLFLYHVQCSCFSSKPDVR